MNKKRAEFAVNKSVDENIWIPSLGRAKGNSIDVFRLNKKLENIVGDINEILRQFELHKITPTPILVRNELLGINKHHKFLIEAYQKHNDDCKSAATFGHIGLRVKREIS